MKSLAVPIIVATELAAAAGLGTPARADYWEPTPPTVPFSGSTPASDNAQTVVNNLQSNGYKVILNKVGTASLEQCSVTSVTPGQKVTTPVTAGAKGITDQVLFTTVYVTANCTTPKKAGG